MITNKWCYLVKNKTTNEKFIMYGDPKQPWLGKTPYLIRFAVSAWEYTAESPYGKTSNVSCGLKYDRSEYQIIHQIRMHRNINTRKWEWDKTITINVKEFN